MAKLTEQRIADRREAIVAAAEALFAERGFAETSMADIVEASGVSTGTVYRYFDNKEAVVMAVTEAAVGVQFDPDQGDPLALANAMQVLIAAATDRRRGRVSNQVWARATGSPSLQTMIAERHTQVCRWLARSIDHLAASKIGQDIPREPSAQALQRAEIIICAISGLQQRVAAGLQPDAEAFGAMLVTLAAGRSAR